MKRLAGPPKKYLRRRLGKYDPLNRLFQFRPVSMCILDDAMALQEKVSDDAIRRYCDNITEYLLPL